MGRRNWCSTRLDDTTGDLEFDIRVEREKGVGETVGYVQDVPGVVYSICSHVRGQLFNP